MFQDPTLLLARACVASGTIAAHASSIQSLCRTSCTGRARFLCSRLRGVIEAAYCFLRASARQCHQHSWYQAQKRRASVRAERACFCCHRQCLASFSHPSRTLFLHVDVLSVFGYIQKNKGVASSTAKWGSPRVASISRAAVAVASDVKTVTTTHYSSKLENSSEIYMGVDQWMVSGVFC